MTSGLLRISDGSTLRIRSHLRNICGDAAEVPTTANAAKRYLVFMLTGLSRRGMRG